MSQLAEEVRRHFSDPSEPPWWPGLARQLARQREATLPFPTEQYSTSRYLGENTTPRYLLVSGNGASAGLPLRIEFPGGSSTRLVSDAGLACAVEAELCAPQAVETLSQAMELIARVPSLQETVGTLVRSAHILKVADPAFDVSFSDPTIPFSIFFSLQTTTGQAAIRTAEAIVHEAMHLQLTLIEHCAPLLIGDNLRGYSPWKHSIRPASGLLHALYVFRVIETWLAAIPSCASIESDYIRSRRAQIKTEVRLLDLYSLSAVLTQNGDILAKRLAFTGTDEGKE